MAQRPQRRLHLIDIENLLGDPRPVSDTVRDARAAYGVAVAPGAHDHVIVACNHGAALEVGLAYTGARLLVRSGRDGADRALLDALEEIDLLGRFDGLVVASGDAIFAGTVAALAANSFATTVVSRPEALARQLRLAAGGRLVPFDPCGHPTSPATALRLCEAA